MTIIDVLLVVGSISLLHIFADLKEAKKQVKYERNYIMRECREEEKYKNNPNGFYGYHTMIGHCKEPRWGIKRKWWERRTYEEKIYEFENP